MTEPPPGLADFLSTHEGSTGIESYEPVPTHIGAAARVLTASKPGAVVLQAGRPDPSLSFWLRDGLDTLSRLIVVGVEAPAIDDLASSLTDDLRISTRTQCPASFLADVTPHHKFDLVAFDEPPDADLTGAAIAALNDGGCLFFACADQASANHLRGALSLPNLRCGEFRPGEPWVVARQHAEPTGRRGGRARRRRN